MLRFAAKAPHGTVHLLIGGLWGADYAQLFEEIGYDKGKTYIATTNVSVHKRCAVLVLMLAP
jgi:hypothetical protein